MKFGTVPSLGLRDCNPGAGFSIPGFGIDASGIPGSRDPGSVNPFVNYAHYRATGATDCHYLSQLGSTGCL